VPWHRFCRLIGQENAGVLGEEVIRAVTTNESARTMRKRRRASETIVGHEPHLLAVAWPT